MNKFEYVQELGCPCMVRSKMNKFEYIQEFGCPCMVNSPCGLGGSGATGGWGS